MAMQPIGDISSANGLPAASELEDYGEMIVHELDRAEADLEDGENQPFSGLSAEVMQDVIHLRNRQFDIFRRHVEIEKEYKIHGADTFSAIATTMRKKEGATSGLLNKLADFDGELQQVMEKFEKKDQPPPAPKSSERHDAQQELQQQAQKKQEQQRDNDNKDEFAVERGRRKEEEEEEEELQMSEDPTSSHYAIHDDYDDESTEPVTAATGASSSLQRSQTSAHHRFPTSGSKSKRPMKSKSRA